MNHSSVFKEFQTSEASCPLPVETNISSFIDNKIPIRYFGLPPLMVEYYQKRGISLLYEWQGRCLLTKGVLEGQNLMYSAPTSGGKTLVAEILMCRRLFHNPYRNRAIIVLPYVSLVVEKYQQLYSVLRGQMVNGEPLKIGCYYGNKGGNHKREHIVVCTIEKANSIINHLIKTKSMEKYKTIIVDEAHMIGDPKRGYLLELLLNKLLFLQASQSLDLQIIALSATLPNIDEMVKYLHAQKYVATQRPNHLVEFILCGNRMYDNYGRFVTTYPSFTGNDFVFPPASSSLSTRQLIMDLVNREANQNKQIILFIPTKAGCSRMVSDLMKYIDYMGSIGALNFSNSIGGDASRFGNLTGGDAFRFGNSTSGDASRFVGNSTSGDASRFGNLTGGDTSKLYGNNPTSNPTNNKSHHKTPPTNNLPSSHGILSTQVSDEVLHDRMEIIAKLKNKGCTETILLQAVERGICYHHAGLTVDERQILENAVRMRILRVIVATTTLAVGVDFPVDVVILHTIKSGLHPLSSSEYRQMAGRAGRRSSGEVFVIESHENLQEVVKLMTETLPPVHSALGRANRGLSRAILEAVYLGLITDEETLKQYCSCTLISHQSSTEEYTLNICESIQYLQSHEILYSLIYHDTMNLQCSRLGCALSTCSLPTEEAILLYRDLYIHQRHISLHSVLFLVYLITPTFMIPSVRWDVYEKIYQNLNAFDRTVATRLQIDEGYISYCMQYRPGVYEPKQYSDPSPEELKNLTHRRFYGALLLRDLGAAEGQEVILNKLQNLYRIDRGELQRFWEAAELYLQLVITMCESLNWKVMKRLLSTLKIWFKKKLPKSYACFLNEEDNIPFPCIQLLAKEELTIRDIAAMPESQLVRMLRYGTGTRFGVSNIYALISTKNQRDGSGGVIQPRRRDYEYFNKDMHRVASILIQRAKERRNEQLMNRDANKLLKQLEDDRELSFLVTPLVSEKRELLNTIENTQSDDGIRSEGVLSASESDETIIHSEEPPSKKRRNELGAEYSIMQTSSITHQSLQHFVCDEFHTHSCGESQNFV